MRLTFPEIVERARITSGQWASARGDAFGKFILRRKDVALLVIASAGDADIIPWEHVSVSTKTRCPTWEEMAWIKSLFFYDEEIVLQFHPRKSQYVNEHPYCLHLWRHHTAVIPEPPTLAVGM